VYHGIRRDLCSLSYLSIDEVVSWVVQLGRGAMTAKFDLKAAYRIVPVHPDDRHLLWMVWDDQLFVDGLAVWLEVCTHDFQCCSRCFGVHD